MGGARCAGGIAPEGLKKRGSVPVPLLPIETKRSGMRPPPPSPPKNRDFAAGTNTTGQPTEPAQFYRLQPAFQVPPGSQDTALGGGDSLPLLSGHCLLLALARMRAGLGGGIY
jgi:hypothetical protein